MVCALKSQNSKKEFYNSSGELQNKKSENSKLGTVSADLNRERRKFRQIFALQVSVFSSLLINKRRPFRRLRNRRFCRGCREDELYENLCRLPPSKPFSELPLFFPL